MEETYRKLAQRIENKEAKICVIGLGYVGLPLAVEFGEEGFLVNGYDISEKKVNTLQGGQSDVDDVSSERVATLVNKGLLAPSTSPDKIADSDVIIIAVPTPLNKTKDPDVSFILQATEAVKNNLRTGQLIILESTTYPGTTEELVLPLLQETGLVCGKDFYLAFSPERVDPGNKKYYLRNTPKVIGGITSQCAHLAAAFYLSVVEKIHLVSSTKAAEMVKLLENTYRSVNIGLVNEIALMCDKLGLNIWEIIEAASTKPFGYMPFFPGPGLGGHCIPIDPHYLSWKLRGLNYYARFIEIASEINSSMPLYVVQKVMDLLNEHQKPLKGSRVLLLGVAYKKDIMDVRESPALDVLQLMEEKGAVVEYNDPNVPEIRWKDSKKKSTQLTEQTLREADCVVIITDHSVYDFKWIVDNSQLVFDTRNATEGILDSKIRKLGDGELSTHLL